MMADQTQVRLLDDHLPKAFPLRVAVQRHPSPDPWPDLARETRANQLVTLAVKSAMLLSTSLSIGKWEGTVMTDLTDKARKAGSSGY